MTIHHSKISDELLREVETAVRVLERDTETEEDIMLIEDGVRTTDLDKIDAAVRRVESTTRTNEEIMADDCRDIPANI